LKKNGFTFIETIITVVVLSTSLLLLYNSYSGIITKEEVRLYYDDPAYIYRTNNILRYIKENLDVNSIISELDDSESYSLVFGTESESGTNRSEYFTNNIVKSDFDNIWQNYNINQIIIAKSELFNCDDFENSTTDSRCNIGITTQWMREYLRTLSSSEAYTYYIIIEYAEGISKNTDGSYDYGIYNCNRIQGSVESANCKTYYSSLILEQPTFWHSGTTYVKSKTPDEKYTSFSDYSSYTAKPFIKSDSISHSSCAYDKDSDKIFCLAANYWDKYDGNVSDIKDNLYADIVASGVSISATDCTSSNSEVTCRFGNSFSCSVSSNNNSTCKRATSSCTVNSDGSASCTN
jgi:hypothetical protein